MKKRVQCINVRFTEKSRKSPLYYVQDKCIESVLLANTSSPRGGREKTQSGVGVEGAGVRPRFKKRRPAPLCSPNKFYHQKNLNTM